MRRIHQITFVCASAGFGLLLACPSDPPDVGECGVDSCYLPCSASEDCSGDDVCYVSDIGTICWPECDGSLCPETGGCIYNPDSDPVSCETSGTCADPAAECLPNVEDEMVCLLPPSHCVPRCDLEECPTGLLCDDNGFCVVP